MNIPLGVHAFWEAFEASSRRDMKPRLYEAFHFDDHEAGANELAQLVLAGTKRATAALLWSMQAENKPMPQPGASVWSPIGRGRPCA